MCATDIAQDLGCLYTLTGVTIGKSKLGECDRGVFISKNLSLPAGAAITLYPGVYNFVRSSTSFSDNMYSYSVTIQNTHPESLSILVLDAYSLRHSNEKRAVGHLVNSSHPSLPYPFCLPNCFLSEERECDFDSQQRPPLVFVVALSDITGPAELLIDYHWRLTGKWSSLTRNYMQCSCEKCT